MSQHTATTNDAADPSHTRTRCRCYVYRRTSAKSCWEVCANVQTCPGKLAFLRARRAGPSRCCFRRNSQTYGFALLNFSAVDAVPDVTDDIIRFSRIGVSLLASFIGCGSNVPCRFTLKIFKFFILQYSSELMRPDCIHRTIKLESHDARFSCLLSCTDQCIVRCSVCCLKRYINIVIVRSWQRWWITMVIRAVKCKRLYYV